MDKQTYETGNREVVAKQLDIFEEYLREHLPSSAEFFALYLSDEGLEFSTKDIEILKNARYVI